MLDSYFFWFLSFPQVLTFLYLFKAVLFLNFSKYSTGLLHYTTHVLVNSLSMHSNHYQSYFSWRKSFLVAVNCESHRCLLQGSSIAIARIEIRCMIIGYFCTPKHMWLINDRWVMHCEGLDWISLICETSSIPLNCSFDFTSTPLLIFSYDHISHWCMLYLLDV